MLTAFREIVIKA